MKSIELVIPDKDQCAEFSEWASPILEHQQVLEVENHKLKQLRDTLLPKLMSGEIDVSKVEFPTQPNSHLWKFKMNSQRAFRCIQWFVLHVLGFPSSSSLPWQKRRDAQ